MQSSPLVQLAMWTWPDGWRKRPDGTLLPILSLAINVRILRTGLLAMPLRLPTLISVNKFSEKGGLLGVTCDEFVLQELLGSGSLPGRQTKSELNSTLTKDKEGQVRM